MRVREFEKLSERIKDMAPKSTNVLDHYEQTLKASTKVCVTYGVDNAGSVYPEKDEPTNFNPNANQGLLSNLGIKSENYEGIIGIKFSFSIIFDHHCLNDLNTVK